MKKIMATKKTSGMGKNSVSEYGGMEKYPSKSAMMKHEKVESKKKEMTEGKSTKMGSPKPKTKDAMSFTKQKSGPNGYIPNRGVNYTDKTINKFESDKSGKLKKVTPTKNDSMMVASLKKKAAMKKKPSMKTNVR